jgi:hypothetical protein
MMNMEETQIIKSKGSAIPGLDYGIDMLDDSPPGAAAGSSSPANPGGPPRQIQKPRFNFNQPPPPTHQPQLNFNPGASAAPPRFMPEDSMGSGSGSGSGRSYGSSGGSGSEGGSDSGSGSGSYESGSEGTMSDDGSGSGSDGSGSGLLPSGFHPEMQEKPLSYEQRRERKINALAALRRLEEAGYVPAGDKKFSFASDLAEIEDTVERLKLQRDLDSSIKYQRKFLIGFANVVEFVCSTEYNIFDLKLEGWSDSIFENINDYDEVFEELYYKYKDSVAIMPEIKLLMMVGGSAMMFHMSREIFSKTSSKVPGFDEVMARDPELKRRYTDTAAGIAKERGMPMPNKQDGGTGFLKDMMKNFGPGANAMAGGMPPQFTRPPQQQPPQQQPRQQMSPPPRGTSRPRVPMNEPDDIDGLLGSLRGGGGGGRNNNKVPEEIDLSEIENLSDLN